MASEFMGLGLSLKGLGESTLPRLCEGLEHRAGEGAEGGGGGGGGSG